MKRSIVSAGLATSLAAVLFPLGALGQASFTGLLAPYYDTWNRMTML